MGPGDSCFAATGGAYARQSTLAIVVLNIGEVVSEGPGNARHS